MRPHDQLLFWLSCKGEVGASLVRKTTKYYYQSLYPSGRSDSDFLRKLRYRLFSPLHRLGHLERRSQGGWAVVPPILLKDEQDPRVARFYGGRIPQWKSAFQGVLEVELLSIPQKFAPEVWEVRERLSGGLELAAQRLELRMAREGGLQILRALPTVAQCVNGLRETILPDQPMEEFSLKAGRGRTKTRWKACKSVRQGLYRMRGKPYGFWYLNFRGRTSAVPPGESRALSLWWMVRDEVSLIHGKGEKLLTPALGLPLPVLVDRALRTASGYCPTKVGSFWEYGQISRERAEEVARILGVRLECKG